jgi:hypothetical protein
MNTPDSLWRRITGFVASHPNAIGAVASLAAVVLVDQPDVDAIAAAVLAVFAASGVRQYLPAVDQ